MPNELTPEEKITIDSYNLFGADWAATHSSPGFWAKELEAFNKYLPDGHVLEIGAGGGRDARELIAAGYDYTGIEPSSSLLAIAQKANPTASFFRQTVYEMDFPDDNFDGFWAAAVLLHIPKARLGEALNEMSRVVRSGGKGFISLMEGEGEKVEAQTSFKRNFVYYQADEFKTALNKNNYRILELGSRTDKFGAKTIKDRTWLTFIVEVNK